MRDEPVKENKNSTTKTVILITLLIMLGLVAAWHFFLPMLGITLAVSAGVWGVAIASVVLICVATLLFFIFTGIGAFILGLFVFVWTVLAIVLFPLLFPVLIPILLLMLVVALIARKKKTP
jgi:hypothetical protein